MAGIKYAILQKIKNLLRTSLAFRWITPGLVMTASASAIALGLGDLTVSSSLGQPLDARISLLEDSKELNPDCFRIVSPEGSSMVLPGDISVKLEQSRGQASLRIQTRQAINEPAFMLTVSASCPERVQRDYAILLDPPGIPVTAPVVAHTPKAIAEHSRPVPVPVKSAGTPRPRHASALPPARDSQPVPRRNVVKHSSKPASEGPRLILSGSRRIYAPESAQLALSMDVGMLDTSRKAEVPLTAAELTDENTALSRKVLHLEQLLANLQKRNAELEQARAKTAQTDNLPAATSKQSTPKHSASALSWPYFLFGFTLLAAAAAFVLYRRRQVPAERFRDISAVTVPDAALPMHPAEEEIEQPPIIKTPRAESPAIADVEPIAPPPISRSEAGTEVKDSVADEVEVFVAHGHADLAIHMLEDHIEKAPDESPVPWLLLLDLLKRENAESKYESYRQKIKLHYNVAMPAYGEIESTPVGEGLESYSHITSELVRLWPTDQVIAYLDDLIYDRRGGSRMGFDPATYRDIVLLRALRTGNAWKSLT